MSKIAVQGNASGTGTFTIAAPNSNTDRTLSLPDSAGTLLHDASSLPAANLTGDVAAARIAGALNATGSAPIYACRAWVNFNGTSTVAIRASGNVSSITDNGTGDYTVNFTTAMPDANYNLCGSSQEIGGVGLPVLSFYQTSPASTTSARIRLANASTALIDSGIVSVSIFR